MKEVEFRKYPKVYSIEKSEVSGILLHPITIEEKIDGANMSIWTQDDFVRIGSRNREISTEENFQGAREYVSSHAGIAQLLELNPSYTLYGEWLVKHSVTYNEDSYRHFYLFDIYDNKDEMNLSPVKVREIVKEYNIKTPKVFVERMQVNCITEDINELVGQSALGKVGEGIVIKSLENDKGELFKSKYTGEVLHAKIVTKKFAERSEPKVKTIDKDADSLAINLANQLMTRARVEKIVNKLKMERVLSMKDTKEVIELSLYDMIAEEAWNSIFNKKSINTQTLNLNTFNRKASSIAVMMFKDIIGE